MGCTALMFAPPNEKPPGPILVSFGLPTAEYDRLPLEIREFIQVKNLEPDGRYIIRGRTINISIEMYESDFLELQDRYRAFKYSEMEHLGRS